MNGEAVVEMSGEVRAGRAGAVMLAVVAAAIAVYVATSVLGRTTWLQGALGELAYLTPSVATVVGSLALFLKLGRGLERRFWGYLGLASALALANEGYYSVRVILGAPDWTTAQVLPLMAGLAGSIIFVGVMLLLARPLADTLAARLRTLVDAVVILVMVTLGILVLLVEPAAIGLPLTLAELLLSAFRVATGLLLIAGVLVGLLRTREDALRPYERTLFTGIAVYALGLVAWPAWYVAAAAGSSPVLFYGLPLLFMAGEGLAAVAAGMRLTDRAPRSFALDRSRAVPKPSNPWVIPVAALVTMALLYAWMQAAGGSAAGEVFAFSAPVVATLLIARSLLVAYDAESRAAESVTDPISNLGTLASIDQRLSREIELAARHGEQVALIVADVDRFGEINDVHGHREGDRALAAIGGALGAAVGGDPGRNLYAVRTAGDEFAVVVPSAGGVDAFKTAVRIRMEIEHAASAAGLPLSASMGIAVYPDHASDVPGMFIVARSALQEAKTGEWGNVLVYDPQSWADRRFGETVSGSYVDTIRVLARAVEQRTAAAGGHGARVATLAVRLGRQLRLDEERLRLLEVAGELHDVGFIAVPDRILDKPAGLDLAERRVIEGHPEMGTRILASLDLPEVLPWVRAHHERWDGRGYPRGLKGTEIPLGARILAVCDGYDAMTHERPYRRALRHEEAIEELGMGRGTAYEAAVVDEFFFLLSDEGGEGEQNGV